MYRKNHWILQGSTTFVSKRRARILRLYNISYVDKIVNTVDHVVDSHYNKIFAHTQKIHRQLLLAIIYHQSLWFMNGDTKNNTN